MLIHQKALRSAAFAALFLIASLTAIPASAQTCGPMDVVFVVDETGSMGNVISEIQNQVSLIADEVVNASGGDYQFGLVGMPDNNVDVLLNFTPNNRAALGTAVGQLGTAGGCGGVPYDEALDAVVNLLGPRSGSSGNQIGTFSGPWRPNATKIVILITDTWPQGFTCSFQQGVHDVKAHDIAEEAATDGIHISSVYVPTGNTPEDLIISIMEDVANTSAGIYKESASDASDLSDIILDIIKNCGGAAGRVGPTSLTVDPTELSLIPNETGVVHINNADPGTATNPTVWSIENLPDGWTARLVPATLREGEAEAIDLEITPGPDAAQGLHMIGVRGVKGPEGALPEADNYIVVHVIVDCRPPFFLATPGHHPESQTVASGGTARLVALPSGDGPFRFQWFRGPSGSTAFPIAGATNSTFTTEAITAPSQYWVRVTNACGSRDSNSAVVSPR
jgi:hypothetical protein